MCLHRQKIQIQLAEINPTFIQIRLDLTNLEGILNQSDVFDAGSFSFCYLEYFNLGILMAELYE